MKSELKIALIQTTLFWEEKQKNFSHFNNLLEKITKSVDIIVLPEMFTTGFTMQSDKFFETMNGATVSWMEEQAKKTKSVICGTVIIKEENKLYNRFIWMQPDGIFLHYDKRHLFRMGNEHENYSPGNTKLIIDFEGWKICPLICYDLRFPVWSRNTNKNDAFDLLLYVANWPARRSYAWSTLLLARAIENQCYVIGVNRIGGDGKDIEHSGNSVAVDFLGMPNACEPNTEEIKIVSINKHELNDYRKSFPAGLDKDEFTIH